MSTPWVFIGEVAGRNTRGVASVTLKVGGKVIMEDRATVEFTDTLALHLRAVALPEERLGETVHTPAVAAVTALPVPQH